MDRNKELIEFINTIMTKCNGAQLDVSDFESQDQELIKTLNKLSTYNYEAKNFATQIAEGNMDGEAPAQDNAVSWPFRALRSSLMHLTWQSQRVAAGDYNQRVDFLGDFSEAFNDMIHQLSIREKTLRMTSEYQSEKLKEMESIAYRDVATGLYNRRYCMEFLDDILVHHIDFCLSYVDLNNLKEINDNFGHEAGDLYIKAVVDAIRQTLRKEDVVCRIGGDEIVIVLYHCSKEKSEFRMEEIQQRVLALGEEKDWKVSISYGIVEVGKATTYKTNELLKEADRRMYEFKTAYKKEHNLAFH